MTDLDLEERRTLAAARQAFSPDPGAAARVLAATQRGLQAEPLGSTPPETASVADVLWRAPGLGARLTAAALLSVGSALLGYGAASVRAPEQAAAATVPNSLAVERSEHPFGRPEVKAAMDPPGAAEAEQPQPAPVQDAPTRTAPSRKTRSTSSPSPRAQLGADEALQLEVSMLKRVQSALRSDEPSRAMSLLQVLDHEVPNGQLREERRAALLLARCALGLGDPEWMVNDVVNTYPGSAYEARLRKRCTTTRGTHARPEDDDAIH